MRQFAIILLILISLASFSLAEDYNFPLTCSSLNKCGLNFTSGTSGNATIDYTNICMLNQTINNFQNNSITNILINTSLPIITTKFINSGNIYSLPYAEGSDLITNGNFSSGSTGWTAGAGWSVPAYTIVYSSTISPALIYGAVYSHNGNNYTYISRDSDELVFTGSVAPQSSGTFTKVSGTGPASITYTSFAYCAAKSSGSAGTLSQAVSIEAGSTYILRFEALQSTYVAAGMDVTIGGNTMEFPTQIFSGAKFFEFYAYNDDPLTFSPASGTQFGIRNISIKKITGSGRFGKVFTDRITPLEGNSNNVDGDLSFYFDATNNKWVTKSMALTILDIALLSTNEISGGGGITSFHYDDTLSGPEGDGGWSIRSVAGAKNFYAPSIFTDTIFTSVMSIDKDYSVYFYWDYVDSWDFISGNIKTAGDYYSAGGQGVTDTYDDGTDSQITFSGGIATAISTAYDISLMTDINYLSADYLTQLTPATFKWNTKGLKQFADPTKHTGLQQGYIAQDVQKFFPDLIIPTTRKEIVTETYQAKGKKNHVFRFEILPSEAYETITIPERDVYEWSGSESVLKHYPEETIQKLKKDVSFDKNDGKFYRTEISPIYETKTVKKQISTGEPLITYNRDKVLQRLGLFSSQLEKRIDIIDNETLQINTAIIANDFLTNTPKDTRSGEEKQRELDKLSADVSLGKLRSADGKLTALPEIAKTKKASWDIGGMVDWLYEKFFTHEKKIKDLEQRVADLESRLQKLNATIENAVKHP